MIYQLGESSVDMIRPLIDEFIEKANTRYTTDMLVAEYKARLKNDPLFCVIVDSPFIDAGELIAKGFAAYSLSQDGARMVFIGQFYSKCRETAEALADVIYNDAIKNECSLVEWISYLPDDVVAKAFVNGKFKYPIKKIGSVLGVEVIHGKE